MIWAQRVEKQVSERRWPYRPPGPDLTNPLYGRLAPASLYACPLTLRSASISPHSALHTWLEYQAAGFTLLQLWRSAHFQAQAAAVLLDLQQPRKIVRRAKPPRVAQLRHQRAADGAAGAGDKHLSHRGAVPRSGMP